MYSRQQGKETAWLCVAAAMNHRILPGPSKAHHQNQGLLRVVQGFQGLFTAVKNDSGFFGAVQAIFGGCVFEGPHYESMNAGKVAQKTC